MFSLLWNFLKWSTDNLSRSHFSSEACLEAFVQILFKRSHSKSLRLIEVFYQDSTLLNRSNLIKYGRSFDSYWTILLWNGGLLKMYLQSGQTVGLFVWLSENYFQNEQNQSKKQNDSLFHCPVSVRSLQVEEERLPTLSASYRCRMFFYDCLWIFLQTFPLKISVGVSVAVEELEIWKICMNMPAQRPDRSAIVWYLYSENTFLDSWDQLCENRSLPPKNRGVQTDDTISLRKEPIRIGKSDANVLLDKLAHQDGHMIDKAFHFFFLRQSKQLIIEKNCQSQYNLTCKEREAEFIHCSPHHPVSQEGWSIRSVRGFCVWLTFNSDENLLVRCGKFNSLAENLKFKQLSEKTQKRIKIEQIKIFKNSHGVITIWNHVASILSKNLKAQPHDFIIITNKLGLLLDWMRHKSANKSIGDQEIQELKHFFQKKWLNFNLREDWLNSCLWSP